MKQKCFMNLFFVIVLSVFAIQAYSATSMNIHWTPNISGGTISHGTTVSGNIWINLTEPMDSDPMTSQSISFTEGYIQEQSHNAPQVSLSMTSMAPPSCRGTNMMSVSMNPSVIYQLEHNASCEIYVKARVAGFKMTMPPEQLTPYDIEQTAYVTGNNPLITQAPDYIISWDPATMTGVNLSATITYMIQDIGLLKRRFRLRR